MGPVSTLRLLANVVTSAAARTRVCPVARLPSKCPCKSKPPLVVGSQPGLGYSVATHASCNRRVHATTPWQERRPGPAALVAH